MYDIADPPTTNASQPTGATAARSVAAMLLPLRLFLAAGWLRAGVEKVIDPNWWSGELLDAFLVEQRPGMLPIFRAFTDTFVAPLPVPTAWLVAEAQVAIGLCLLLNRWPRRALWAGVILNVCFTSTGRVNPSAFYLVMSLVVLIGLSRPVDMTIAWRRAVAWIIPAVAMLPFARTLAPSEVIDDPALMLSFVCGLAALATVTWSAAHLRFAVDWIDLLPRSSWSDRARRLLGVATAESADSSHGRSRPPTPSRRHARTGDNAATEPLRH